MKILALLSGTLIIVSAGAMFIRHDVPDSAYRERAKAPEFDCVGLLLKASEKAGSCVLVSPHWALTDAHCVKGSSPEALSATFGAQSLKVRRYVIHPDYESDRYKGRETRLEQKGIDVALLELDGEATVAPATILTRPIKVGEKASMAGFGIFGKGDHLEPIPEPKPIKRAGTNVFDGIGGDIEGKIPDWLYITDFDDPDGKAQNRCGGATPTELECLGSGGDSGSGAFVFENGKWQLAALFSTTRYFDVEKAATGYGNVSMYTRLDRINDWIQGSIR